jgi:hypothetical protein
MVSFRFTVRPPVLNAIGVFAAGCLWLSLLRCGVGAISAASLYA